MPGLLEDLGQGMQRAGGILSPEVYEDNARQKRDQLVNIARTLEITRAKRSLDADVKFDEFTRGLQPNGMDSASLLDTAKKIPIDVLSSSPKAQQFMGLVSQVQSREAAAEAKKEAINVRYEKLAQDAEIAKQRSEDVRLGIQERAAADKRHQEFQQQMLMFREQAAKENIQLRREMAADRRENAQSNLDFRREAAGLPPRGTVAAEAGGPTAPAAGIEAATYDYLVKNQHPPVRGGIYQNVMKNVEQIAKANGMTTEQLITASADVKTRLIAKKTFETRVQNLGRAENQLELEIPVMEDAMSKLTLPSIPVAARGKIWVLRQQGNPDVVKLDQAAETVFREFEGIVTGNPGTLNVQDVVNAHNDYKAAQTPENMKAAIQGMRRIITNAKKANDKTRGEIMGGVTDALRGKTGGDAGHDPSAQPKTPNVVNWSDLKP